MDNPSKTHIVRVPQEGNLKEVKRIDISPVIENIFAFIGTEEVEIIKEEFTRETRKRLLIKHLKCLNEVRKHSKEKSGED